MNRKRFFSIEKPSFFAIIFVTAIVIIFGILGESATKLLRYERELWHTIEWWRVFSGHFVHLSWVHLALNMAGFWLIAFLYGQEVKPAYLLSAILLIALGTSIGLFIFSPGVIWYVGLSGVLHGLIIIGALKNFSDKPWPSTFILIGIFLKIIWEQLYAEENAMEHLIGGNVIYDAHLYGATSGLMIICIIHTLNLYNSVE